MAYTMQQVCDRARETLNDADKMRYTDAELLGYANEATAILKSKRPDLFFGQFSALPGDKALVDNLPLDDILFPAVAAYVVARAEFKNDEAVLEQRAQAFFGLFKEYAT